MARTLMIVESPAKAKTIEKYLGKDFEVQASAGHIRDLPSNKDEIPDHLKDQEWARLAIDVQNGFQLVYVIPEKSRSRVAMLREKARNASHVILATDPDREGEAIAWHLREVLKLKKGQYSRVTFNEITKEAILHAVAHERREIDMDLVAAQEARRAADRIYGYGVSPVLWRNIASGLSAGRVQSVAARIVIERDRARMAFVPANFFGLEAEFEQGGQAFQAKLISVDGQRIATGRDFDARGQLKNTPDDQTESGGEE